MLLKKWTINCAVGELLGIAAAGAIAYFVNNTIAEPYTLFQKFTVLICMIAAGCIEGFLLGWFQWTVLKKIIDIKATEWIKYTVAIAATGWLLGMLPSLYFITPSSIEYQGSQGIDINQPLLFAILCLTMGLAIGSVFGLVQYIPLRKYYIKARLWILGNAIAWSLGIGWIYMGASLPDKDSSLAFNILSGIAGGVLAGLTVGLITGVFLTKLIIPGGYKNEQLKK